MEFGSHRKWDVLPDQDGPFAVVAIHDSADGLHIALEETSDRGRSIHVAFDQQVAYRVIDESNLGRLWRHLGNERWTGSTYVVDSSPWLERLRLDADGLLDDERLLHYAIYTDCTCIEVASVVPPEISS